MARNARIVGQVRSHAPKQVVFRKIDELINQYFMSTLGTIKDIRKLVMALIHYESGFDAGNVGILYPQQHIEKVKKYSVMATKLKTASPEERANIENSFRAYGLMQVTGYYAIKGCSSSGAGELEKLHNGIWKPYTVSAGTSVYPALSNGIENLNNQILAGLLILESKYLAAPSLVQKGIYNDRTSATFGPYLGSGADGLGTTPQMYVTAIMGGNAYRAGNDYSTGGDGTTVVLANPTTTSPTTTPASGNNLTTAGC